jgi:hypothetical protein
MSAAMVSFPHARGIVLQSFTRQKDKSSIWIQRGSTEKIPFVKGVPSSWFDRFLAAQWPPNVQTAGTSSAHSRIALSARIDR